MGSGDRDMESVKTESVNLTGNETPARFLDGIAEISRAVMDKVFSEDILALIVSVTAKVTG